MSSYLNYNIPIINNSNLLNYPIPDMTDTLERFLELYQFNKNLKYCVDVMLKITSHK